MKEHKLIQSYVIEKYFISTAYRRCSAVLAPNLWYYETIVWKWDQETRKRGHILDSQDSGSYPEMALRMHCELCAEYGLKSNDVLHANRSSESSKSKHNHDR